MKLRMKLSKLPIFIFALLSGLTSAAFVSAADAPTGTMHEGFAKQLSTFCYDCHGNANAEADLNLEEILAEEKGLFQSPHLMKSIRDRVANREMPPVDYDQHSETQRDAILQAIEHDLAVIRRRLNHDPGDVVMPRLNRDEYKNVIRDLSGGVVNFPAERFFSAPTRAGEGFANVGEAQGVTTGDIESLLDASREVLNHLRVGPAFGFEWSESPLQPIENPSDLRSHLMNETMMWYTTQQSQQVGNAHFEQLEAEIGSAIGAYFEAMWRYRHREQLGQADATLEEIAADYPVPLNAEALRRWWEIIQDDDPAPILQHAIDRWKSIPSPNRGGERVVRETCCDLIADMEKATSDFTLNEAPTYEISLYEEFDKRAKQTLRRSKKEGWMDFEILLNDSKRLYLITTDAWDGGDDDVVLWTQGKFHFGNDTSKSWETVTSAPEVIEPETGEVKERLDWGSFVTSDKLPTESQAWTGPKAEIRREDRKSVV